MLAGDITRTPVIATLHGRTGPLEGSVSLKGRLLKFIHAQLLKRSAHKIIAISEFVKEFNAKDLNIDPEKIKVIYNCTNLGRFDITIDVCAFRQKLGIWPQNQVIAFIGGISRQKGAHYFIKMADVITQKRNNAKFLVVGKGYFEDEMKRRVREKELSEQFIFTGWRSDIPRVMHAIDILVMPAYYEGFGRVITEAMAASKPVVAFDSGAIPEVITHGKTGYVVPYGDVKALAFYVLELLQDDDKRKTLGQHGRLRVEEHFSPEVFVKRTSEVLRSVIDSGHEG
jgi:glycosyltransferase involved in cell wall biosynthesis